MEYSLYDPVFRSNLTRLSPPMHVLFGLLLSLMLVVSASAPSMASDQSIEVVSGWSTSWLVGRTLTLQSETRYLVMRFGNSGFASVTVGQKGGPLTGPLMPWSVHSGKLVVGGASYEFVSIRGNLISVRVDGGHEELYELSKQ